MGMEKGGRRKLGCEAQQRQGKGSLKGKAMQRVREGLLGDSGEEEGEGAGELAWPFWATCTRRAAEEQPWGLPGPSAASGAGAAKSCKQLW